MAAIETKIWLALKSRIDSLPLSFAKAWPAEMFEIPHSGGKIEPYIRIGSVTVSPTPIQIAAGKPHTRAGTLILTLVHPLVIGNTMAMYTQYAGQIAAHFEEGSEMRYHNVCVSVTAQPHVQPGYEDSGFWTIPVSIPWRTVA